MFQIQWTNKFSGESGYVKSISTKEKHFVNTFEKDHAKAYKTSASAEKAVKTLITYGEADNNHFVVVSA